MKRLFIGSILFILLCGCLPVKAALVTDDSPTLPGENTTITEVNSLNTNLVGSPVVIGRASSPGEIERLIKGRVAASVLIELNNLEKLDEILEQTNGRILPVFMLKDIETALKLAEYFNTHYIKDTHIASHDAVLLKAFREASPLSTASLFVDSARLTLKGAYELVRKANECMAKNIIIDASELDKKNIEEIQRRTITVWVATDDTAEGNHRSLTSGATGIICGDTNFLKECARLYTTTTLLRRPFIVGHRGAPGGYKTDFIAPENTMAGFKLAHEVYGVDIIETDTFLTKDGDVILIHDKTFERTTDIMTTAALTDEEIKLAGKNREDLTPGDLTLEQIKRLDTGEGEKVPTLTELLEYAKTRDIVLFLESKDASYGIETAVINTIASQGDEMFDKVVILSYNVKSLEIYKQICPFISLANLNSLSTATKKHDSYAAVDDIMRVLQPQNCVYSPPRKTINKIIIDALAARGISVWPWTFTNAAEQRTYIGFGVTGVTTNFANWTRDAVMSVYSDKAEYTVRIGDKITLAAVSFSRSRKETRFEAQIIAIEGAGHILAKGGVVTGVSDGEAVVMLKVQMPQYDGVNSYTLYTQPVKIIVKN